MVAMPVALPRVSFNLVTSPQTLGLQQQRALVVGALAPAVRASGKITFAANPLASATITLNGTAWTFVASGASGAQTNIAGSLSATLAALVTALNASGDTQVVKCTYYQLGTALYIINKTPGTGGNTFTLAASLATVSAGTLTGGAAAPGTATGGTLVSALPQDAASINALFGIGSHISQMANAFRNVNKVTVLDALPLADNASAVQAWAQIVFAGSATASGSLFITVENGKYHTYEIDLVSGNTPATILTALEAAIAADKVPFTSADDGVATIQFTALNGGTHANDWLLAISGSVPGITATLTGWANGATNPSLTTLFDPVATVRYQNIVWPAGYTLSKVGTFLDGRKNVVNNVMDGRAFVYRNVVLATAESDALALNSSEVVLFNNAPVNAATWVGAHLPSAPDTLAARFAAARARRFEDGISISDIVATPATNDQVGGISTASLPYFNTPFLNVGLPSSGTGYNETDQETAENNGVSVVGVNMGGTGVVAGPVVTTWLKDGSGNADTTWKYLEWRDTHGAIREYIVNNCRSRFQQARLTNGDVIANYSMANETIIRGYLLKLCLDLMGFALIQAGQKARQYIQDNMVVVLDLANRKVSVTLVVPMTSQLGNLTGTVQVIFVTS